MDGLSYHIQYGVIFFMRKSLGEGMMIQFKVKTFGVKYKLRICIYVPLKTLEVIKLVDILFHTHIYTTPCGSPCGTLLKKKLNQPFSLHRTFCMYFVFSERRRKKNPAISSLKTLAYHNHHHVLYASDYEKQNNRKKSKQNI